MKKILAIIATISLFVAGAIYANAGSYDSELTDAQKAAITTQLEGLGYNVGEIEAEDGMYEAYATKDGVKYEIYLDKDMNVVEIEKDD